MQTRSESAIVAVVCALAVCSLGASGGDDTNQIARPARSVATSTNRAPAKTLSKNDRHSVIEVALHTKKARHTGRDCSHLVHAIYERAGFPYTYADSEDLYAGTDGFRRVTHPEPADLVVWHGHVGIVIRPSGHEFFSMLSTGPGIDDYRSRYWRSRGQPRFYRYVKRDS